MAKEKPVEPKKVVADLSVLAALTELKKIKEQKVVITDLSLLSEVENNPLLEFEIRIQLFEIRKKNEWKNNCIKFLAKRPETWR
jgi:hypothetical protein